MSERQPLPIPDPQHTPHEGGNGSPGIPPTLHERANPSPESALSRALEEMRALYEKDSNLFASRVFDGLKAVEELRERNRRPKNKLGAELRRNMKERVELYRRTNDP